MVFVLTSSMLVVGLGVAGLAIQRNRLASHQLDRQALSANLTADSASQALAHVLLLNNSLGNPLLTTATDPLAPSVPPFTLALDHLPQPITLGPGDQVAPSAPAFASATIVLTDDGHTASASLPLRPWGDLVASITVPLPQAASTTTPTDQALVRTVSLHTATQPNACTSHAIVEGVPVAGLRSWIVAPRPRPTQPTTIALPAANPPSPERRNVASILDAFAEAQRVSPSGPVPRLPHPSWVSALAQTTDEDDLALMALGTGATTPDLIRERRALPSQGDTLTTLSGASTNLFVLQGSRARDAFFNVELRAALLVLFDQPSTGSSVIEGTLELGPRIFLQPRSPFLPALAVAGNARVSLQPDVAAEIFGTAYVAGDLTIEGEGELAIYGNLIVGGTIRRAAGSTARLVVMPSDPGRAQPVLGLDTPHVYYAPTIAPSGTPTTTTGANPPATVGAELGGGG